MKNETQNKTEYCKKIIARLSDGESISVLYGIVARTEEGFIQVTTARRNYLLNKDQVLSISDTTRVFIRSPNEETLPDNSGSSSPSKEVTI